MKWQLERYVDLLADYGVADDTLREFLGLTQS